MHLKLIEIHLKFIWNSFEIILSFEIFILYPLETDWWFISAENKDIKKHSNLNNNENLKDSKPFYADVEPIKKKKRNYNELRNDIVYNLYKKKDDKDC